MKYLLSILLLCSVSQINAQTTPRKLLGLDPVTSKPGYIWKDTLRTYYYHSPLYTVGDTIYTDTSSIGGGQWTKIGDNIRNSNTGKVGINTDTARAQFEVVTPTNTTQLIDSTGIISSTPFDATNSQFKSPGPLVFKVKGWNTTTSASQTETFRIGAFGKSGAGGSYPDVYFQVSKDSITYANLFHTTGNVTIFDGAIQGSSAVFTGQVTSSNFVQGSSSYITTNNFAAGGLGQVSVGLLPYYTYPDAIFSVYSNSQGMLPPVLTTAQRDSINLGVVSVVITNGGTGYTSAPTVNINGGTIMNGVGTGGSANTALTAVLSGNSVASVTIVRPGAYRVRPTITFTGGGGSGATGYPVMSQQLHVGLTIYNSTTNRYEQWDGTQWQGLVGSTEGTAAPTSTPTSVGQQFVDTTNKKVYVATGTSSSADWTILN